MNNNKPQSDKNKLAQGMIEYGLIAALFAIICVTIAGNIGTETVATTDNMTATLRNDYIDQTYLDSVSNTVEGNNKKNLDDCADDDGECITKACTYEVDAGWLKEGEDKPSGCTKYGF